jgi:hypothetical protein
VTRRIKDGGVHGALLGLFVGAVPACRYGYLLDRQPLWPATAGVAVLAVWLPFVISGAAIGIAAASLLEERLPAVGRRVATERITAAGLALVVLSPCLAAVVAIALVDAGRVPAVAGYRQLLPYAALAGAVAATLGSAAGGFVLRGSFLFRAVAAIGCGIVGHGTYPVLVALMEGPR